MKAQMMKMIEIFETDNELVRQYRRAINHWGPDVQKSKALEELDKLRKEVLRDVFTNGRNRDRLLDEMGDVANMMNQLMMLHIISPVELDEVMKRKMKRTMERIDREVEAGEKSYYECEVE
jgi:hypothetical protein